MSDARQWLLGVDGGGTKTVAWIAAADLQPQAAPPTKPSCATASQDAVFSRDVHCLQASRGTPIAPLGQATAGPSNPQSVGWDTSLANLDSAIDAALADARASRAIPPDVAPEPFAAAVLALAGSDRPENRRRLLDWAAYRNLAARLSLAHDGQAVLAAGSPDYTGIALIAGTGTLAFGRDRSGKTARAGGWGFLAGDEGSGYWIAVEGLRAAARANDGYGDRALRLARAFAAVLGAENFEAMIPSLYERADNRAAVASLARVVWTIATAADAGDTDERDASEAVAMRILMQAARHWAELIQSVAEKLELSRTKLSLALGGGVFAGNRPAFNLLAHALKDTSLPVDSITVVEKPVVGAVRLAQRLLSCPAE